MDIKIINSDAESTFIQNNVNISAAKLISLLWSLPEPHHKKFIYKDKDTVTMSEKEAQEKLQELLDHQQPGQSQLSIKKITHNKLHRHIGLTLKGESVEGTIQWNKADISESEFLKYRNALDWSDFFATIQRTHFRRQSQSPLKGEQDNGGFDDTHNPRADLLNRQLNLDLKQDEQKKEENNKTTSIQDGLSFILKHPLFHGAVVGAVTGAALTFAGFSGLVAAGVSLGLGAVIYGVEYMIRWRQAHYEHAYQDMAQMKPSEIQALTDSYKSAFTKGLEADHWGGWAKSLIDTNAWKEYRAFGAGLKTAEHHDDQLRHLVKP